MVCSSSMNRMIWPSLSAISFSTAFRRSSNSPRNLAPATSAAHVQRDQPLVAQTFRHVAVDDALRQTLDDGRLADAGLADQHRIILGAAADDVDHAANFFVAPDHRVELALARQRGQVTPVFLQALIGPFRVLAGDALAAANAGQRLQDGVLVDAVPLAADRRRSNFRPAPAEYVRC